MQSCWVLVKSDFRQPVATLVLLFGAKKLLLRANSLVLGMTPWAPLGARPVSLSAVVLVPLTIAR
jgi:hypothetical protein